MIVPPPRGIMRRGFAADQEGGDEVGVDHAPPVRARKLDHRLTEMDPGIVHQDIHRDSVAVQPVEGRLDRRLIGHIERQGRDRMARPRKVMGGRLQPGPITPVQNQLGAGLGKPAHHGEAEAARGTRDQGRAARQVEEGQSAHAMPCCAVGIEKADWSVGDRGREPALAPLFPERVPDLGADRPRPVIA